MPSIRSQILTAIHAVLNADGAPCSFERSRMTQFALGELPAGNIIPEAETNQIDADECACVLTVQVGCVVATAQDPVDDAAEALLIWVEKQIMADGTLGGLAVWIEKKETQWFLEEKGVEMCGAIVKFDVNYRTALTDTTANRS